MNTGVLILIVLVLFLAGLTYRLFFTRIAVIRRKLRGAERVSIGRFPEGGIAKVQGFLVYAGEPLTAPLSGRRCAKFSVRVQQFRSHGHGGSWHTIVDEQGVQDFFLDDGTGKALAKMAGARFALTQDRRFSTGFLKDATPELDAFLARHGRQSQGLLGFNKRLRFLEAVLEGGEDVAVFGPGRWEEDPDTGERWLVLETRGETPLYVSDDVKVLG